MSIKQKWHKTYNKIDTHSFIEFTLVPIQNLIKHTFLPVFVVELPAADFFFLVFLVLVVFCVGEVVLHLGKSRSTSETEAEGSIEAAAEATEADGWVADILLEELDILQYGVQCANWCQSNFFFYVEMFLGCSTFDYSKKWEKQLNATWKKKDFLIHIWIQIGKY